jgi:hypothetical protein
LDVAVATAQSPNAYNSYDISVGGFKGLFNSLDASLIPDGYCAAMSNVRIDNFGVAHSVYAPTTVAIATALPTGGIIGISYPFTRYYQVGSTLCTSDGATTVALSDTKPTKVVEYINNDFYYNYATGLKIWGGTIDAAVNAGFGATFNSRAVCVYKNRLYFNISTVVRYSHPADASLATTWNGAHVNNFQKMMEGGPVIEYAPTSSGLVIFCAGRAYLLTEPKEGSLSEIYTGQYGPQFFMYNKHNYCDGTALYYGCWDGLYAFAPSTGPKKLSEQLTLTVNGCHVGCYDGRLWFLVFPSLTPTTGTPVLYALNTTTGAWEQYDSGAARIWTALCAGGDSTWTDSGDLTLGAKETTGGTSTAWAWGKNATSTTVLPWSFTTKNFTPSLDAFSRPKYVKLTYAGQAAASVATIQFYVDGTLADTVTQDMAGSGLHHKEIEVNPHTPAGALGNSFQVRVSGEGTFQILNCGVEFNPRGKGDSNERVG